MPDPTIRPAREPAFNAPWTVLTLAALLIATHVARVLAGVGPERFALTGDDLAAGLRSHVD